jgi:ubiquinone/menaquinone biosynthesis C-methylase UbiE
MEEIWRVGKNKGIVEITAPFPSSKFLYTDPTHKRAFVSKSFDFLLKVVNITAKFIQKQILNYLKLSTKKTQIVGGTNSF